MENWQEIVLWAMVFLQATNALLCLANVRKGTYMERKTALGNATIAMFGMLLALFFLTLLF